MFVIRIIVIGTVMAGVLAGIGALVDHGIPPQVSGVLLFLVAGFVGLRMIGGLFARGNTGNPGVQEGSSHSRPAFRILEEGKDDAGRPYYIIQGDSRDASRLTENWTYPGDVSWVHEHLGHYKWRISVEDWNTQGIRTSFKQPKGLGKNGRQG